MKLHLSTLLATVIVAVQFAPTIKAETVIGTGNYYDVGKGTYSSDPQAHEMGNYASGDKKTDGVLCWAAAASNLIQYWQDTYYKYAAADTPNGLNTHHTYGSPQGTRSLVVYEKFLSASNIDDSGMASEAFNWWMKDTPVYTTDEEKEDKLDNTAKGYYSIFENQESASGEEIDCFWQNLFSEAPYTTADLKANLQEAFAKQGQGVSLRIWQINKEYPISNSRNHAVTCWGYESDATGITALYLSDSDDYEYGVFRVNVTLGEVTNIGGYGDTEMLTALVLSTDEQLDGYGKGFEVALMSTNHIATPAEKAEERENAKVTLQAGATITSNALLEGENPISGAGITIGDGTGITVLSSDPGATLSLTAGASGNTAGLTVQTGSLASLYSLSVEGYDKGGIVNAGRVYLHEGEVNLTGNKATDGAAISNANYVSIQDNTSVSFTGNTAIGKGGAISNTGEISIRGNAAVTFSGNSASQGNDIYNAAEATVNIADNGSVLFEGSDSDKAAVVNNGTLYLKSGVKAGEEDPETGAIEFSLAALDSSGGTTYVGQDINGKTADTVLSFSGVDDALAMRTYNGIVTELRHLKVNASEIVGLAPNESYLHNANVATYWGLQLSGLTLDTSSTFGEMYAEFDTISSVNMDNVVIDLAGVQMDHSGDGYSIDLSGMFNYLNMDLDTVYFDASSLLVDGLKEGEYVNVNFGLGDEIKATVNNVAVLFGNGMMTSQYKAYNGGNVEFRGMVVVPEPATGTLSLLALAALAARRRRK